MSTSPGLEVVRSLIQDVIADEWWLDGCEDVESRVAKDTFILEKETVKLLAAHFKPPTDAELSDDILRRSALKVELPLLKQDHNLYMQQLRDRCTDRPLTEADLAALREPSPQMPQSWTDSASLNLDVLSREGKLLLDEDAVIYLSEQLKAWHGMEDTAYTPLQAVSFDLLTDSPILESEDTLPDLKSWIVSLAPLPSITDDLEVAAQRAIQLYDELDQDIQPADQYQSSPYFIQSQTQGGRMVLPILRADDKRHSPSSRQTALPRDFNVPKMSLPSSSLGSGVTTLTQGAAQAQKDHSDADKPDILVATHTPFKQLAAKTLNELWSDYYRTGGQIESLVLTPLQLRWPGLTKLERTLQWRPFPASRAAVNVEMGYDNFHIVVVDYEDKAEHHERAQETASRPIISDACMFQHLPEPAHLSQIQTYASSKRPPSSLNLDNILRKKVRRDSWHGLTDDDEQGTTLENDELFSYLQLHRFHRERRRLVPLSSPASSETLQSDTVHLPGHQTVLLEHSAVDQQGTLTFKAGQWHKSCQIVVAPHIISQRELLQRIELQLPELHIVERAALPPLAHSKIQRLHDADVSVSPTVGIMLTTLQKLKQRPLPGQIDEKSLLTRILCTAQAYESLLVIVQSPFALQDDDCRAIAQFVTRTAIPGVSVSTDCILGDETDVVHHLCRQIRQHHITAPQLTAEETRHERLLRTLGLNSYAAQTMLSTPAEQGLLDKFMSHSIATVLKDLTHQYQGEQTMCSPSRVQYRFARGWFG